MLPVVALVIITLGLLFDLSMPLGIAGGVPYIALVMLGLWARKRETVIFLAILATSLTLLGYYISPPGGVPWIVLTNRMLAMFAIWAVAIVIYLYARLLDSLRMMARVVKQSPVGIMITDTNGVIEYANPKVFKMSGYNELQVLGNTPSMFKSKLTASDTYLDLWNTIRDGGEWRGEIINKHEDKSFYWVALQVFPVTNRNGKIRNFVAIMEDISERKRGEQQLLAAMQDAENANLTKSNFLANMSHEFRTPLNAILGFSETIKMEILGPVGNEKYKDYIVNIFTSATHLRELIDEILDLSKIEAGKQELHEEEIDVATLVKNCLTLVNEQSRKGDVRIDGGIEQTLPHLLADARMIKQVLLNLLSNAIKFTPEGGIVTLRACVSEHGQMEIVVSDTGIGISNEDFENVFTVFGQAENIMTRSHEGSGLGLPISRRLIELHAGTLELDSVVGQGTAVTITFPAQRTLSA